MAWSSYAACRHAILPLVSLLLSGSLLAADTTLAQGGPGRFATLDARWAAGAHQETLDALREMSHDRPADVEILWRLAWVKTDIGRELEEGAPRQAALFRDALADAERAVQADPNHPQAHLVMAIAAGLTGVVSGIGDRVRYSRVVRDHVNRAIELNPRNDLAYHIRGIWNVEIASLGFFTRIMIRAAYGGLPEASHAQAAEDFRRALELDDRIIHRIGLARALVELGRDEEARAQLRKALEMPAGGQHADDHRRRARQMLADLGDGT